MFTFFIQCVFFSVFKKVVLHCDILLKFAIYSFDIYYYYTFQCYRVLHFNCRTTAPRLALICFAFKMFFLRFLLCFKEPNIEWHRKQQ